MILGLIIDLLCGFCSTIINLLPELTVTMPDDVFQSAELMFKFTGYFIPLGELMPLFIFSVVLSNFKLILAIWDRIRSFIPSLA